MGSAMDTISSSSCAAGLFCCPSRFTVKERDPETGNDNFGARSYAWRLGRWLSSDWSSVPTPVPYANLTNPQTLNLYAMVADDPQSFADLDGHDTTAAVTQAGAGDVSSVSTGGSSGQNPNPPQQPRSANPLPPPPLQKAQQTNLSGEIRNIPKYNFALDLTGLSPNVQFNSQSSNVHPVFTPDTAAALNSALITLNNAGIVPTLNSAFRTFADQARMRSGGSGSRPAALFSWHEAGNAVDIQPGRSFPTIRSVMQQNGFTWGGNWRGNQYDPVHFEMQRPHSELFIDILKAQAAWSAQQ